MLLKGANTRLNRRTASDVAGLGAALPQPSVRRSSTAHRQHQLAAQAGRRVSVVLAAAGTMQQEDVTSVSATGAPRSAVLGVLGGGQLGRMMALAAANLGVRMKCLDPTPDAPAAVAAEHMEGHFRDAAAIEDFVKSKGVDVLTMEIEHINTDALMQAAKDVKVDIEPSPETIRIIQDKFAQKQHFAAAGVPLPEFRNIKCRGCMEGTGKAFGYPFMLKAKRLAYDGRGNYVVKTEADIDAAAAALGGYENGLYAEKFAPFVKELAVMVVRNRDGGVVSYPIVETIHKNNICHVTEAPAGVPPAVQAQARAVAEKAIACLSGAGIFGVEMFLLGDGTILLNEVAPRPHNSGHYTMDGCVTSQFENHVRAVLGWPLGETRLNAGCAIMLNLLGEADGDEGVRIAHQQMAAAYATPGAKVHWYGKDGMKLGRKVGHINIVANTREEARAKLGQLDAGGLAALQKTDAAYRAAAAAAGASAGDSGKPLVGIIMGSDSDLATMKAAAQVLEEFGVPLELTVVSAHRTPERMFEYARTAHQRGLKAIIAGAGGAAHLPGMVAAMTPLPVIGVPVKPSGAHLDGLDALLSIVQMPKGVPVATVAIGNAANAGLLAIRVIAASDPKMLDKMLAYQNGMTETVLNKAAKLEEVGWAAYKM
ncbi:hypothetical protein CHLRE_12g503300v5 [Chlamydomonas reinhardtii]|uniref:phosphoribosylaminoimidazole carboxylase n=1 Tax=Chlamydomonas reinhardtii TaxID=3055 RepID=A8IJJ8_CHLRE|nr:uncharacterized protein CHLRE_12g503300v5 [Chlamydomonas reinhardtii]PNW74944.1 hypothetical protein CHLRE_12g503300v5 [Chlamydomonas reinhardtii]|eukprot:XP_001690981.1 phosphoribosylaminoimidazole carboxylase, eukaryotic-type [Chlamydomonas reinhardtii]